MQSDCTVLCRGLPQSELRSIVEEGLEYEKVRTKRGGAPRRSLHGPGLNILDPNPRELEI